MEKKEQKENPKRGNNRSRVSKRNKININRINEILELPKELTTNNPKVTMIGFDQLLIENHKGILEYQDIYIRIKTSIGIVSISGRGLGLNEMRTDEIVISGKIEGMEFESTVD